MSLSSKDISIPMVLEPEIFRAVLALCKTALVTGQNSNEIRKRVVAMLFALRGISMAKFGHEHSIEAQAISSLIERTSETEPRLPKTKAESALDRLHRLNLLTSDQITAALLVRDVWEAFSRMMGARSTNYETFSGGAKRVVQPVEAMGEHLWKLYWSVYQPWVEHMRTHPAPAHQALTVKPLDLVLKLIVDQRSLRVLSKALGKSQSDTLDIIRDALIGLSSRLKSFHDDERAEPELEFISGETR